jgi:hypothetical protein
MQLWIGWIDSLSNLLTSEVGLETGLPIAALTFKPKM